MQLTNLYVTLSSIMPKIKQTDTHFNHVPACLISVFIQFLFALPLLYQCKYTLKYNEEAQQDCCYNVGPGADQFSIGFNQSRNRTVMLPKLSLDNCYHEIMFNYLLLVPIIIMNMKENKHV